MRKILYISIAAMTAFTVSCAKEGNFDGVDGKVRVEIFAESEDLSKTTPSIETVNERTIYHIDWEKGDKLGVFNDLTTGCDEFTGDNAGPKSTFTGLIQEESNPTMAVYPYYKKARKIAENKVETYISPYQDGNFHNAILAGRQVDNSNGYRFKFEAVSGIVRLDIPADSLDIKSVELITDAPIAGNATITFTEPMNDSEPIAVMVPGNNTVNSVVVSNADGSDVKGTIYFATLPVDGPIKLTFRFIKGDHTRAYFSATIPETMGFTANIIQNCGKVKNIHFHDLRDKVFTAGADGHKVRLSPGNLQYRASDNSWRFAENQWDAIGDHPGNTTFPTFDTINGIYNEGERATQDEWIDLFPFGSSGWTYNNRTYLPYASLSTYFSDYFNEVGHNLTGAYANGDWGVYNRDRIVNGFNAPWRLLTMDEIKYIMETRKTNIHHYYKSSGYPDETVSMHYMRIAVKVGDQKRYGLLIFPDGFEWDADKIGTQSYYTKRSPDDRYDINYTLFDYRYSPYNECKVFTIPEFMALEELGVAFLPCASYRNGYNNNNVLGFQGFEKTDTYGGFNISGFYWSSTRGVALAIYEGNTCYYNSDSSTHNVPSSTMCYSVRLVMDVASAE